MTKNQNMCLLSVVLKSHPDGLQQLNENNLIHGAFSSESIFNKTHRCVP